VGLLGCLQRTPVKSWKGYVYDFNNSVSSPNFGRTTAFDFYTINGVMPSGVIANPAGILWSVGLANTAPCLGYAAFRNPGVALTGTLGKTASAR
jgi:hypothetical protein